MSLQLATDLVRALSRQQTNETNLILSYGLIYAFGFHDDAIDEVDEGYWKRLFRQSPGGAGIACTGHIRLKSFGKKSIVRLRLSKYVKGS